MCFSPGGPFAPQIIFYDGVEVRDERPATLALLLKEDMKAFKKLHPDFSGRSSGGKAKQAD